ncbi:hypothetical protein [Flavobacterium caseinilyticum]|uniref:PglZ domain-containing protein n=1 Tax=Flavobacterium caseinilyticum TaxID=2541732 RepID=A0A4R5B0I9_9FLAO|nr:hypothetical protein [Flavobacterium caseinilyticum]TDD78555.1 hypothetical protein E0F89_02665 [Flavobacterium caseinilyticum]
MIDTWFKKDLEKIFNTHPIVVIIDESKEATFLLEEVKEKYQIFNASNEIDELKVKYEIEKKGADGTKYLIYTNTPKEQLKFIREYCETNGSVEIKHLDRYIKEKVVAHLNINLHLEKEELIAAAKVSLGKDQTYWMNLSHNGASEIFNLEKEILPFLHSPKTYLNKYDKAVQELFFKKVNELIGQVYISKSSEVLATEVVFYLLDGLANNNPNKVLLDVYNNWLDSKTYQKSFDVYLKKYKLEPKTEIFNYHPAHPFLAIDELWLEELGKNISNKSYCINFLPRINQRISNKAVHHLGINFWKQIKILLEFDEKNINQIASYDEAVAFYTSHFYKLDKAIRALYATFLDRENLMEPLQSYYKNYAVIFLDKWFKYIEEYKSNQTGKLQEIIDNNASKTAIVVGDGVSYEFAQDIIEKVSKEYILSKDHQYIFAGLPSETEHNMSQLYIDTGKVVAKKQDREAYILNQNKDKSIGFIDLEMVNENTDKEHYLICSYKDPDKLGETYQQKALKYFDQVAEIFATKIEQLLKNGYQNVYLLTDHGYVLTGILDNSDKIEVAFNGNVKKSERFIRTEDKQTIDTDLLIEKEVVYGNFNYCYFTKRVGPFITPGVYGFAHGGLSPQETIIPFLKWSNDKNQQDQLQVMIANKKDLNDVTGGLFSIVLKASSTASDLFSSERKVTMLFFADNKNINESDILTIEKDREIKKEFRFGSNATIEVKIVDAVTKEQLDKVIVKQNKVRDLGGLL